MRWSEFELEQPELAAIARQSFESYEVIVLATRRREGPPRLSLVSPLLLDGALFVATLAGDGKTTDLQRDPACSFHTLVTHRTHVERAFTAEAAARAVDDEPRRGQLLERAKRPEIRWFPDAIHELDVTSARSVGGTVGGTRPRLAWKQSLQIDRSQSDASTIT